MGKSFFEVFPTLQMEGEEKKLLSEVEVTKVSTNRNKDFLRVYIQGNHLIPKKKIYMLEREIKNQLFPTKNLTVKLMEKYTLSSQYTPKNLMDVYKESILLELKSYSILLYNLFRKAKMDFDREGHMILTLEDSIVAADRAGELIDILEKIICERCGLTLMIEPAYEENKDEAHKKEGELQIAYEVENIVKMSALGQKKEQEVTTEEGTKTAGTKADTPKREEKNVAKQTEGKRKESCF